MSIIDLAAGSYVVGVIDAYDAQHWIVPSGQPALECVDITTVFDTTVPGPIEIQVWTPSIMTPNTLSVRNVETLCPVPASCCGDSGSVADVACADEGLRDCVIAADESCEGEWDAICTARAMFQCGADCT